ncbi:ATP-binding protein [Actinacidiphila paucisporea]|uniref:Predicted ATPase n=1 Tax=Actinacidiphila paucisporea TaxID=310782 RepID=A0A1M7MYG9_9ACTN|nr:BTAD domain-containing putative transcriptional regulator [Actinacidiphila paucisporea]SHM96084.1 Predicted ATPase [Actinacidiphila paucisporea]
MSTELTLLSGVGYRGREITAPRLRGLLALLAADLRTGCSTGRLVEGLWADELPDRPGKAVQVLVARVRSQLGADLVVTTPTGYRLALDEEQVDTSALLLREAAAAERHRAGDHAGALAEAEAGLALWDGGVGAAADEDLDDPVVALRVERVAAHRSLGRVRALALARTGRRDEAAALLAALAEQQPRDEEVLAELLRCEAETAGPAAALTRYDTYRRQLRDALGTDPGAALKAVHRELLRGTAPVVRHGVLHDPNPLVGRDADVAAVAGLLASSRVVSVVGPGGLGKTRLAHVVSRGATQRVVHFVALAGVLADEDVLGEVASAIGAGAAGTGAGIAASLGPGPALLVLDNCEQVVGGVAALVRELVSLSKDLRVLATSRASLGLTSEAVYQLPALSETTSVELFVQRARAARPGSELPEQAVAELCRHLDGLPLAVELAAARVRVLSVPEIARRLQDRFSLLSGGVRDVPERHRTLHAVVEWSWNLLAPDGQAALRTLSVFPGGFTADAADHVLAEGLDGLLLLEQLADQSLVTAVETDAGLRFRMLESVREFAAARLAASGDQEAVTGRFLDWARDFGCANHDVLFRTDPLSSWERVRAEQDNLVVALRHALARGDGDSIAAVAAVLATIWSTGSSYARLVGLAADTGYPLSHYRPGPAYVEVSRTVAVVCTASLFMGLGPRALRSLVTLRRLPPAQPDTMVRALSVVLCAFPEIRPPHYPVLRELCASREPLLAGIAECVASYVWEYEYDVDAALESARRMLVCLEPLRHPSMRMLSHARISELCLRTAQGEDAYRHLLATMAALELLGDRSDSMGIRSALALACLQRGEAGEAEHWLAQAERSRTAEQADVFSTDGGARAEIALARGLTEIGLRLWRDAVERLGAEQPLPPGADPYDDPYGDPYGDPYIGPWALQIRSVAVIAHAQHRRLEPVAELIAQLRKRLPQLLAAATAGGDAPAPPAEFPACGTALLALGMARLAAGDTSAVRLVALSERLGVARDFQPTMSSDRIRQAAEEADRAAYADAVSEYAALGRAELPAVALGLIGSTGRG